MSKISGPGLELERSGRGVAFGDLDNDGDIDLVVNNQNDPPTFLRNEGGNRSNCIQVRLQGTESNRDGIGARVSPPPTSGSSWTKFAAVGAISRKVTYACTLELEE